MNMVRGAYGSPMVERRPRIASSTSFLARIIDWLEISVRRPCSSTAAQTLRERVIGADLCDACHSSGLRRR